MYAAALGNNQKESNQPWLRTLLLGSRQARLVAWRGLCVEVEAQRQDVMRLVMEAGYLALSHHTLAVCVDRSHNGNPQTASEDRYAF